MEVERGASLFRWKELKRYPGGRREKRVGPTRKLRVKEVFL